MDDRLQREKEFHDREFSKSIRASADKFYAIAKSSRNLYKTMLLSDCKGKRVLEYGCGTGYGALFLVKNGAHVTGIDVSDVAIRQARERFAMCDVPSKPEFHVMNAERLEFADQCFDVICGTGILHHLNLGKALPELSRVLKDDGRVVFIEALGHNPFINLYRRLTPQFRTEDEHPLLMSDLRLMRRYFDGAKSTYFHLLALLAVPVRESRMFERLLGIAEAIDERLLKLPLVRSQAWMVVIELWCPRRTADGTLSGSGDRGQGISDKGREPAELSNQKQRTCLVQAFPQAGRLTRRLSGAFLVRSSELNR